MKKSAKITLSAIFSALAAVFMLISYFPYLTYAVPAVSGLFIMAILIETGFGYAFGGYVVSSVLIFLLAEKESAVLYICLFGFYPIVKALLEKINKPVFEWVLKIIIFNVCAVVSYYIVSFVLGISFDDLNTLFKYGIYIFWALCNIAFVLYDIAISRISAFYIGKFHFRIQKIFKK